MPSVAPALPPPPKRPVVLRLMIPVKNPGDGDRAIAYAIRQRAQGLPIAVCLLHVDETATSGRGWHGIFARAERLLQGLDIEYGIHVRAGPVVFSILDAAEALDCGEIVVAAPVSVLLKPWSRRIVAKLLAARSVIPVVAVDRDGMKRPPRAGVPDLHEIRQGKESL